MQEPWADFRSFAPILAEKNSNIRQFLSEKENTFTHFRFCVHDMKVSSKLLFNLFLRNCGKVSILKVL